MRRSCAPAHRTAIGRGRALKWTLGWVVAASLVAACGAADTGTAAAATTCGGSHAWPPAAHEDPVPPGVVIEPAGPGSVRVRNSTGGPLRFEVAVWRDTPCVGVIAESPIRSDPIEPGHEMEVQFGSNLPPGPAAEDVRVGVVVYGPGCDTACTDAPLGFGWIDVLLDDDLR